MDNFKKCSKCGEVKLLDCFYRDKKRTDGMTCQCKNCMDFSSKKYKKENLDKARMYDKKREKAKNKNRVKNVKDVYIKSKIKQQTGIPHEHITQDLIETKRLHILIQRKLKDLTK